MSSYTAYTKWLEESDAPKGFKYPFKQRAFEAGFAAALEEAAQGVLDYWGPARCPCTRCQGDAR